MDSHPIFLLDRENLLPTDQIFESTSDTHKRKHFDNFAKNWQGS